MDKDFLKKCIIRCDDISELSKMATLLNVVLVYPSVITTYIAYCDVNKEWYVSTSLDIRDGCIVYSTDDIFDIINNKNQTPNEYMDIRIGDVWQSKRGKIYNRTICSIDTTNNSVYYTSSNGSSSKYKKSIDILKRDNVLIERNGVSVNKRYNRELREKEANTKYAYCIHVTIRNKGDLSKTLKVLDGLYLDKQNAIDMVMSLIGDGMRFGVDMTEPKNIHYTLTANNVEYKYTIREMTFK